MIRSRNALIAALLFPILALMALTAFKETARSRGEEVILPVVGFDPRDLLSGHYLIYQIDYGVEGVCAAGLPAQEAFICLDPKSFSYSAPAFCPKLIRGICNYGRFEAGIERFYVPENQAAELEAQVRAKKGSIVLSLFYGGHAQIKDLLLDGVSWKKSSLPRHSLPEQICAVMQHCIMLYIRI